MSSERNPKCGFRRGSVDPDRHNAKMARRRARDKIMAGKSDERVGIVHTGKGKGKSSAAFGMIFRCIAHQLPALLFSSSKAG